MKELFSSQDCEEDVDYTAYKYTGFRKKFAFMDLSLE